MAILLCTFDGAKFLNEQLQSIEAQDYTHWQLFASDDGSVDNTLCILEDFRQRHGSTKVGLLRGANRGAVGNFLSLSCNQSIVADAYAFCDQDDIWESNKLSRALGWLATIDPRIPALYCSRTRLVDVAGREIGFSPLFRRQPSFSNALVQNIGGGNTMVFNRAARDLLIKAGGIVNVPSHDWWLYLVVSACGGAIRYDAYPGVRYRQHNGNLVGSNQSWGARAIRARRLLQGRLKGWSDQHIEALKSLRPHMTPTNRKILRHFICAREHPLPLRIAGMRRIGIHRQTLLGNIGLAVAVALRKI